MNMLPILSTIATSVAALTLSLATFTQETSNGDDRSPKTGAVAHPLSRAAAVAADPANRQVVLEDAFWALMNSKEFYFNH